MCPSNLIVGRDFPLSEVISILNGFFFELMKYHIIRGAFANDNDSDSTPISDTFPYIGVSAGSASYHSFFIFVISLQ